MSRRSPTWLRSNEGWLLARVAALTAQLEGSFDRSGAEVAEMERLRKAMRQPPALEVLADRLALSTFEQDLLTLVAGVELSPAIAAVVGAMLGHGHEVPPTFALALDHLPNSHWSALSPGSPLRRLRMIEVAPGASLATGGLRIDERVLHHLLGADYLDARLMAIIQPITNPPTTLQSHRQLARRMATAWADGASLVQVVGPHETDRLEVIAAAADEQGVTPYRLTAEDVPTAAAEREGLQLLWEREVLFLAAMLVVEIGHQASAGAEVNATRFAEVAPGSVISAREPIDTRRPSHYFDVALSTPEERWQLVAPILELDVADEPPPAIAQFALSTDRLLAAAADAMAGSKRADVAARLWAASQEHARPRLQHLAQRIEPAATWRDLVVTETVEAILREIKTHVRYQSTVYDTWGFRDKSSRGLGVTALFFGASGTGKTMAAEVLANDLSLDLYRIDLSSVVSKYIGETEKNLRQVFDAAEAGGAILLFDEADALFGKRTEVKDSHDRHANIEVSYLLQRMEEYRGLAILTTNLRDALDDAFLRRIRFVVKFPFPTTDDRNRLWRSIWPDGTPVGDLDFDRLASLALAGGNIRSVAVDAAFRAAAAADEATGNAKGNEVPVVDMGSVASSVRAEARKIDMQLSSRDWGVTE